MYTHKNSFSQIRTHLSTGAGATTVCSQLHTLVQTSCSMKALHHCLLGGQRRDAVLQHRAQFALTQLKAHLEHQAFPTLSPRSVSAVLCPRSSDLTRPDTRLASTSMEVMLEAVPKSPGLRGGVRWSLVGNLKPTRKRLNHVEGPLIQLRPAPSRQLHHGYLVLSLTIQGPAAQFFAPAEGPNAVSVRMWPERMWPVHFALLLTRAHTAFPSRSSHVRLKTSSSTLPPSRRIALCS
jgi:hypothetical protein